MPPSLHAVLGASSAKMWMTCPPSARLNEKLKSRFGERTSGDAAEGTKAHALAELKVRLAHDEINEFSYKAQRKTLGAIPKDMEQATDSYCDVVMSKLYEAQRASPDACLLLEQRVDFSEWVPNGFGTSDAVIVSDRLLEVIDYKHGKGIPVSAVENPQARLYGLGAISAFGQLYDFEKVRNTIVQPRLESVTEETLTRKELLDWGDTQVRAVAQQAWKGEGEFKPGAHCRFCAARAICYARVAEAMKAFTYGFDQPGVLPDDAIPDILAVADLTEAWLKDIRAYALSQALRGQNFRGYKLVHGKRPNSIWGDEEAVKEQLIRAGYTEDQYTATRFRGVADIKKLLGAQAFRALVGQYVVQGDGALTLVPEDDKRPEYSSAEADFADLADDENDKENEENE